MDYQDPGHCELNHLLSSRDVQSLTFDFSYFYNSQLACRHNGRKKHFKNSFKILLASNNFYTLQAVLRVIAAGLITLEG